MGKLKVRQHRSPALTHAVSLRADHGPSQPDRRLRDQACGEDYTLASKACRGEPCVGRRKRGAVQPGKIFTFTCRAMKLPFSINSMHCLQLSHRERSTST